MKNFVFGMLKQATSGFFLSIGVMQAASAGIIITKVQDPSDTAAVRFNTPQSQRGPSTTVTGTVGPANDRYLVNFTSDEQLVARDVPAAPPIPGIPPQVSAVDGGLMRLGVSVQDSAFTSLYLNFRMANVGGNPPRFADVTVSAYDGEIAYYDFELRNGNNFLRVDATGDTLLRDLAFLSPFNVVDVRQARLGGLQEAPIPEPATLLSLGIGVAGMLAVRRRARPVDAAAQRTSASGLA